MKKVVPMQLINRLVLNMLYMHDLSQRLYESPQSHPFSFISTEKYCALQTLYWPMNIRIKKKKKKYNSCQATANTRHCSLRDLLGKYKSLHLIAWLYKQSPNGVYFWIQGHKICHWPSMQELLARTFHYVIYLPQFPSLIWKWAQYFVNGGKKPWFDSQERLYFLHLHF